MSISIVVADDHPVVLMGLASLFASEEGFDVVARCVNGAEALQAVESLKPDVVLLDLNMPRLSGTEVLRGLKSRRLRTRPVILSASLNDAEVRTCLQLGARGVVLKEEAPQQLLHCVRTVHEGGIWLEDPELAAMVRSERGVAPTQALTDREREIAALIGSGMRNKEIARKLDISEGTVKAHLHNIYRKLGVDNRLELALYSRQDR